VRQPAVSFVSADTAATGARRRRAAKVALVLAALFVFRLLYGLSSEFFFEDETQIFLMGLRWYATGDWPYFGPDVVWTESVIPGALQPLLVGAPLHIAPIPEAPYLLLNLISFAALAAFAWYLTVRLPRLPAWLVWGWLMTMPWTLDYSTHVLNPSYLLAPALVFFIGFFEAVPMFRLGVIREPTAFVLMGAALGWVMQIHLSWPLLVPYVVLAWMAGWRQGVRAVAANGAALAAGLLVFGSLLIPTPWGQVPAARSATCIRTGSARTSRFRRWLAFSRSRASRSGGSWRPTMASGSCSWCVTRSSRRWRPCAGRQGSGSRSGCSGSGSARRHRCPTGAP
jgi:hypothetical protein